MIDYLSIEFLVTALFFINFFLIIFVYLLLKRVSRLNTVMLTRHSEFQNSKDGACAAQSAGDIIDLLEPLVKESKKAAVSFDEQVKEKKRLLKELNEALDSRIISINLLLSRADALQKKLEQNQVTSSGEFVSPRNPDRIAETDPQANPLQNSLANPLPNPVIDQQHQILDMYSRDIDIDTIARQLSVPKGEIKMVIDLKKKFLAMEQDNR